MTLTLASPVVFGDDVTVSYTVPTGTDPTPIQDLAGNDAAAFTRTATNNTPEVVTPTPDTIPPEPTDAEVDGTVLKITFDEPLDTNSLPDGGQFSVKVNGTSVGLAAANAVAISGLVVTLTLASPVVFGDDVTVSYTVPTGTDPTPIQDLAGNDAAAFTRTATNKTPEVVTPTPDTIPPKPTGAEVDGAVLKITFDEPLDTNSLPDGGQFSVKVNGTSVGLAAANAVAISGLVVTLTLASPVVFGDDVTVSYTVPTGTDPTPIQDLAGNDAAAFTRTATNNTPEVVTPTPDTIPPKPTGAEVDGAVLKITFDEPLDTNSLPDGGQFSVKVNGTSVGLAAANAVAISGLVVTLTLASPVVFGDDVTVSYTVPTGTDPTPIQDLAGNDAAAFTRTATNNTPEIVTPTPDTIPPKPTGAEVDGAVLKITFDEPLDTNSLPDGGQFSVKVNGTSVGLAAANAVAISGLVVTLTLASPVVFGDDVTVSYTVPTGTDPTPIQDLAGNDAAAFTRTATNNTPEIVTPTPDTIPPKPTGAEVDGAVLKITFDEPLDTNSLPDGGQFSVKVNGTSVGLAAANAVAISGLVVTLTLASPVVFGDDVTVSYTVPTGTDPTPIQDLAGNDAAAFTRTATNNTPEIVTPDTRHHPPLKPTGAEGRRGGVEDHLRRAA